MRRLYIHIGPHKTGTTYLQQCLFGARNALSERGVLYPSSGLGEWQAHHRLAFALKGRRDRKEAAEIPSKERETEWIVEEVSRSDAAVVILSSEEFFSVRPDQIQYLASRFEGFDVKAVFYARRQDELFVSNYTQIVKTADNDITGSIYSFLDKPIRANRDLNMFKFVSNWEQVLGRDNIVGRMYERRGDMLLDFFGEVVGEPGLAEIVRPAQPKMVNVSPTLEAIEVMRHVKEICPDVAIRRRAYRMLSRIYAGGHDAGLLLSPADRFGILRRYNRHNRRLFRRYFNDGNRFLPELLVEELEGERQQVSEEEARKMAEKVVAVCRKGSKVTLDSAGEMAGPRLTGWWRGLKSRLDI